MSRGPLPRPNGAKLRRMPKTCAPDAPDWLSAEAALEWARVVPLLLEADMLASCDRAALTAYCLAWAELVECTAVLEEQGRFIEEVQQSAKGEVIGTRRRPHPALSFQRDAMGRVRAYSEMFGFTPQSRARMNMEGETGEDGLESIYA